MVGGGEGDSYLVLRSPTSWTDIICITAENYMRFGRNFETK